MLRAQRHGHDDNTIIMFNTSYFLPLTDKTNKNTLKF